MHINIKPQSTTVSEAVSAALLAVPLEQRWLLANRVKALSRIKTGEVLPTRVELAAITDVTGIDLSALHDELAPIVWDQNATAGQVVRTIREALAWDRVRLAAHCGVDVSAISRIEGNRTAAQNATVAGLAAAAVQCGAPDHAIAALGVRAATDYEALEMIKHLDVQEITPDQVVAEVAIGRWLTARKREMEAGTCDPQLAEALVSAGVIARRDVWNERFLVLQARPNPTEGALLFKRSDPLETWVSDQRRAHAAGTLPAWKREALEAIPGWRWGTSKHEQWSQSFQRVSAAIDAAGLECVKRSWKADDGFECGDWLMRARTRNAAAPASALTEQRAVLLAALPPSC